MVFKLLVTVAIVALVWYGFRVACKLYGGNPAGSANVDDDAPKEQIEDLTKCSVCDTFVESRGATDCDRDDCPMTTAGANARR